MISYVRDRWAWLVICVGVLFGTHAFYVIPAFDQRDEQAAKLHAINDRVADAEAQAKAPRQSAFAGRVSWLASLRFGSDTLLGEQDHIHEIAAKAGLTVESVIPDGRPREDAYGPFVLQTDRIRVSAYGEYDAIASFFAMLDEAPMAVIEAASISPPDARGRTGLTMTLRTITIGGARAVLAEGNLE